MLVALYQFQCEQLQKTAGKTFIPVGHWIVTIEGAKPTSPPQ